MSNPYNFKGKNETGGSAQTSSQTNPPPHTQANPSASTHDDGGARAVDARQTSRDEASRFEREGAPGPEPDPSTTRAHSQPQPGPAPFIRVLESTSLTATASAPDVSAGMLPWEQWEDPMAGVPSVTPIAQNVGSTSLPVRSYDKARVEAWAQGVDAEQSARDGGGAAGGTGQGGGGG
jgi:hypothetical protein